MGDNKRVALGLSVHTGWAACVATVGGLRAPRIVLRQDIELLGDPERFLFHRAAELSPAAAERAIATATADVGARAKTEIARVVAALRAGGQDVVACGIVAGARPMPAPLADVLAAHPRIHLAEGCFYRDVLRAAAESNGLATYVVAPKALDGAAAKAARVGPAEVPALLAAAGRAAGRPWARDQKAGTLAAWIAIARA